MSETQSRRRRSHSESLGTRIASTKPQVCERGETGNQNQWVCGKAKAKAEITQYGNPRVAEMYARVKVPHGVRAMQGLDLVKSGGLRARVPSQPPSCQKAQKGMRRKKRTNGLRGDFAGEFFSRDSEFPMTATGSQDSPACASMSISTILVLLKMQNVKNLIGRVSLQESEIAQGKPLPLCLIRTQSQTQNPNGKGQASESIILSLKPEKLKPD